MFNKNRPWHSQFKRKPKIERTVNGILFDSVAEASRYVYLLNLERIGAIATLERQIKFMLVMKDGTPIKIGPRVCSYKADFSYTAQGKKYYEEYKGFDDSTSRLRRAVVEAIYGIAIYVVKKPGAAPASCSANHPSRKL